MRDYSCLKLLIIEELLDDKGHANWEIAEHLDRKESNINPILKQLEKDGAIYHGPHRKTTKHGSIRPNQPEIPYYITKNLETFGSLVSYITSMHFEANKEQVTWKKLFGSNYVNAIIKTDGFDEIYNVIEPLLHDPKLKKIVSETLLMQKATIETYGHISEYVSDYLLEKDVTKFVIRDEIQKKSTRPRPLLDVVVEKDYSDYEYWINTGDKRGDILIKMQSKFKPISSRHIKMLTHFNPLEAVSLYRNTIHDEFTGMVSEFEEKLLISRGLSKFLDFDNYLSPFTSYPTQSPNFLLFSRPFQRIYDDFYLIEDYDRNYLSDRAKIIYDKFADFLFEYFRNEPPQNQKLLEDLTKQFVYLWNIASTNFDFVGLYLEYVYGASEGSGKYHIQSAGIEFKIIDLETNELIPGNKMENLYFEPLPMTFEVPWQPTAKYMTNPFEFLRPCNGFGSSYNPKNRWITIRQIISDLKSKFAEYGWDYDNLRESEIR